MLIIEILRTAVVELLLSKQNKLIYTQSECRTDIEQGYADCSSVMTWAFENIIKQDIGEDTAAQIVSPVGRDVDDAVDIDEKIMPNTCALEKGDLLFFKGEDEKRPFGVGHVEMYAGYGKLIGQNSFGEKGTAIKDMKAYCEWRAKKGWKYIKTRRYILDDNICR